MKLSAPFPDINGADLASDAEKLDTIREIIRIRLNILKNTEQRAHLCRRFYTNRAYQRYQSSKRKNKNGNW